MPVRAVVFDLDGTLVDSEPVDYAAACAVLAPRDLPLADYLPWVGRGGFSAYVAQRYGVHADEFRLGVRMRFLDELARLGLPPLEGARELVQALTGHGLPLAVASQSSHVRIEAELAASGLGPHFTAVVSVEDVGGAGKPAPDVYLHAARVLGVAPEDCLAVEDSVFGVQAALAAGMRVVQSRGSSYPAPPQPGVFAVIDSLAAFDLGWLAQGS